MFKTFMTIVIGSAVYLFSLGLFLNYFKEVSNNIAQRNIKDVSIPLKIEDSRSLLEIQNRILGYKNTTIRKWNPDEFKFQSVVPDPHKEIECLDNDCRWTKLIDNN